MSPSVAFDSLARWYKVLEFAAFGRALERARFCLLPQLVDCRRLLVLGEGDGRCLARLLHAVPNSRIHCVDGSPAMIALAEQAIGVRGCRRVHFECADVLSLQLQYDRYDAVITCFFLDCFTSEQAAAIVARVSPSLRTNASWLFVDFALPARGVSRWRAQQWLSVLYLFFRWQTRLSARTLPPSERLIQSAGFQPHLSRSSQWGLLRSVIFTRSSSRAV